MAYTVKVKTNLSKGDFAKTIRTLKDMRGSYNGENKTWTIPHDLSNPTVDRFCVDVN